MESAYVGPINQAGSADTSQTEGSTNGIMIFDRGDGSYKGQWRNGRYDGYGVYKQSDGTCYDGSWQNGLMHG